MFLTCKQVSNKLAEVDYEKLSPFRKATLKFHVAICPVCGRYNSMVMKFQDISRNFRKKEEEYLESDEPDAPHLSDNSRIELQEKLNQASR